MTLQLGQRIVCTAKYVRWIDRSNGVYKYWRRIEIKPREGIYIGRRTLQNGVREWQGDGDGYIFHPQEYVQAVLVVFNEHEKPVLVPIDSVYPVAWPL